jgi:hypothetical protein
MANIYIVTDQRVGEPDFLSAAKHASLVLKVDGNTVGEYPAPEGGWCHEYLHETANILVTSLDAAGVIDAHLGTEWVGSSEV